MTTCEQIEHDLRTIIAAWPDMLPILPRRSVGPSVTTAPGSKPAAPIAVLSLRRWTAEQLAAWCLVVIEDRDLKHASVSTQDVPGMCAFLLRHADYLAGHEAGREASDEIDRAATACEEVAVDLRRRRFKVGPCISHETSDLGERVPCRGTIVAYLSNDQTMLPWLHCDTDEQHSWDGSQWGELGRHVCTIRDAARITGIPERTIRQWVDSGEVVPVVKSRPVLVRLDQITGRRASA